MNHRERNPEQYAHPMVGRLVRGPYLDGVPARRVVRVVPSRFGFLAMFAGSETETLISTLAIVPEEGL